MQISKSNNISTHCGWERRKQKQWTQGHVLSQSAKPYKPFINTSIGASMVLSIQLTLTSYAPSERMAKFFLSFLVLCFLYIASAIEATVAVAASANFIKSSCQATKYPAVCIQSLSVFAGDIQQSPRQLTQTALAVSIQRAQATKTFVTKLRKFKGLKAREYEAIKDCFDEMADTVDTLGKSVRELKNMGRAHGPDFFWHMSNVETWVSAALTDENTCMDGFSGKALNDRIKASVKARITNIAQVTSNALALVNQYAGKH